MSKFFLLGWQDSRSVSVFEGVDASFLANTRRKRPGGALGALDEKFQKLDSGELGIRRKRVLTQSVVGRGLIINPVMSHVGDFHHQRQIIPAKTGGILPLVSVLVDAADRHIVTHAVFRGVLPDSGFDAPETNFMNRTLAGSIFLGHGIAFQKQTNNRTDRSERFESAETKAECH